MAPGMPLYIMAKPPLRERLRLHALAGAHGLDANYAPEKYHCTLLRLGESSAWPERAVALLCRRLDTLDGEPFPVAFDQLEGDLLRGRKGLDGLSRFRRTLVQCARKCGVILPHHRFWLHLSLAYSGRDTPPISIEPIIWRVDEILLIRSIHGVGHRELGRWPVRRRQLALDLEA